MNPMLPNPLGGERRVYRWRGHRIAYVVRGETMRSSARDRAPTLFIHSIHAAAWSAEWRFVFPALADDGPAYALDLLGFGASDRPPIRYQAPIYVDLVRDFVRDVIGEPAILVGSSLGGTYAIAAAAAYPDVAERVVAIGPAGVTRLFDTPGPLNRAVETLFRSAIPGTALFRALVSRPSIRFFLREIYAEPESLTDMAVELFHRSANLPNARFAPAAFVGMSLNRDIRTAIRALPCPLLLLWGKEARQTPYQESDGVRSLVPNAQFVALPGGDLPHEEHPQAFVDAVHQFEEALVAG